MTKASLLAVVQVLAAALYIQTHLALKNWQARLKLPGITFLS